MITLAILATAISLNGIWDFSFKEDARLESAKADFAATDQMSVPGCWDVLPKWYLKHGTGLYRRTFNVETPIKDGVLVVEGMGVRARFAIDGRDLGLSVMPYARLEIPVGALAAGEHTIFAAVDNVMTWPEVKLARPYYDFYFYGGFYHGIKLVEREPKIFVRTLDYRDGTIEVEIEGGEKTVRKIPNFKLWSPESPNLTTIEVAGRKVRFGIRQIEAKAGKLFLNGKPLFLKGFNRHESSVLEGAATSETTMLRDLQNLKDVGGNFLRGAHYQQCERFLELCDEAGVLVWEESLGWQNGGHPSVKSLPMDMRDEEFCALQIRQTREMVRASFNHPSVIIYGFLNECNSEIPECKALIERLVKAIRDENSGRLITFAMNHTDKDICSGLLDLVSFNTYPGTIPCKPGNAAMFKETVSKVFNRKIALCRKRCPDKPIMISESGCGAVYGVHDPNASPCTEEFQAEYLTDIFETLWANDEISGYSIWQMNDGRTRERYWPESVSAFFGCSVAGCFDQMRRPKLSVGVIRKFFKEK